jgi:hypothetical protein
MGKLVLPESGIVYVDTSVLIYTIEGHSDYYSLLQPLWLKFQLGEVEIVSSELISTDELVCSCRFIQLMGGK